MVEHCQGETRGFAGRCARKPTVSRGGKPYCWQHDPERIQAESSRRWEKRRPSVVEEERGLTRDPVERAARDDVAASEFGTLAVAGRGLRTTFGELPIGARFAMADSPAGHVKVKTGFHRWKWDGHDGYLPVAIGCPADREVTPIAGEESSSLGEVERIEAFVAEAGEVIDRLRDEIARAIERRDRLMGGN